MNDDLDSSLMLILLRGVTAGITLSWLAHLVVPPGNEISALPPTPTVNAAPATRGAASAAILLGAVALCLLNEQFNTATVMAITVGTLLLQPDLSRNVEAGLGLLLLNLVGGVLASFCAGIALAEGSLTGVLLMSLLVSLVFGWRIALGDAGGKLSLGALSTFLILFGIGLSPLPADTGDSFATRITFVVIAVVYTLLFTILLWRRETTPPAPDRAAMMEQRGV